MQNMSGVAPVSRAPDGHEEGRAAQLKSNPKTSWIVETPSISRGSISGATDQFDVRQYVGWKAPVADTQPLDTLDLSSSSSSAQVSKTGQHAEGSTTPDQSFIYPYPNLSLPIPSLNPDFRMSVTLQPRISIGSTPFGHRNWISFTGGSWSGSWGAGVVLPGGQDSQLVTPDGSARLETNYLLQTHEAPPAYISVKTTGWRTGPQEVLAKLADPELADGVDPSLYKFRIFIEMETGDERYRDSINYGMWVGSGMRRGLEVIYDAYRVS